MRTRLINAMGERFVHVVVHGTTGAPLAQQAASVFEAADAALRASGLNLDHTVRSRVFGRSREARAAVSDTRFKTLTGRARAATSSFIAPAMMPAGVDVALELFAMYPPERAERIVREQEPRQSFIRWLGWGPMVFLAGQTSERPTFDEQLDEILPRVALLLEECGCGWPQVTAASFFLHRDIAPDALFAGIAARAPLPLGSVDLEQVEGYSKPGKLIEIEITARRRD
ncbi:MAG TPA: hypothetical protein VL402_00810 [Xanthobacteraceae bacterium]|nr:hypothetical protein [Xanthobacteraceae bacterium]